MLPTIDFRPKLQVHWERYTSVVTKFGLLGRIELHGDMVDVVTVERVMRPSFSKASEFVAPSPPGPCIYRAKGNEAKRDDRSDTTKLSVTRRGKWQRLQYLRFRRQGVVWVSPARCSQVPDTETARLLDTHGY